MCNIPEKWERHSGKMPDSMGVEDPVNWRKVKKLKSHAAGHKKYSSYPIDYVRTIRPKW